MILLQTIAASLAAVQPPAADVIADKSVYHLFNPVPAELLREMTTDRPDTTESPFTVDAGHVQFEMSFVEFEFDGDLRSHSIAPTNIRIGMLNNLELALVVQPYLHVESPDDAIPGAIVSESGFGDMELRLKLNLWGNDGGSSAFALLPFVKLPTASDALGNDEFEGGLIVPLALEVNEHCGIGLMAQFAAVYDDEREAHDLEFLHTAVIGHDLIGDLAGYLEYIGIANTAPDSQYQVLIGAGLTYALNSNWQLDAGVNFGVAGGAPEVSPFIGMSMRF